MQNGNTEASTDKTSESAPRPSFNGGSTNGSSRGGDRGGDRGGNFGDKPYSERQYDRPKGGPMEVAVDHNVDKAMKVLKRKLIREGLFKELKLRRYFEKPSEKKKRKAKESIKKLRKEEARNKKNPFIG